MLPSKAAYNKYLRAMDSLEPDPSPHEGATRLSFARCQGWVFRGQQAEEGLDERGAVQTLGDAAFSGGASWSSGVIAFRPRGLVSPAMSDGRRSATADSFEKGEINHRCEFCPRKAVLFAAAEASFDGPTRRLPSGGRTGERRNLIQGRRILATRPPDTCFTRRGEPYGGRRSQRLRSWCGGPPSSRASATKTRSRPISFSGNGCWYVPECSGGSTPVGVGHRQWSRATGCRSGGAYVRAASPTPDGSRASKQD